MIQYNKKRNTDLDIKKIDHHNKHLSLKFVQKNTFTY